jgi:hypothetical protein
VYFGLRLSASFILYFIKKKKFLTLTLRLWTCRYHSESGWQTLLEIIVEHYGFEVDQSTITIFICLIPVIIDACVKLWVCSRLDILNDFMSTY